MGPSTTGDLGSILGIWGHPDDEAWLSAGLMARAVAAGRRVTCVTATKGEAGFPDDDPRSITERAAVREAELASCLALLGVTEHRWLGYGDGQCADVSDDEATATLTQLIDAVRPDTVLTFGPDGATGHPDHIAVCRWTTAAVQLAGLPETRLMYATKTAAWRDRFFAGVDPATVMMIEGLETELWPEEDLSVLFRCDDDLVTLKVAAMRAQASQLEAFVQGMGLEAFTELVRDEQFRDPVPSDVEFIERARTLGHS
jgi:LmbE family N-acetylglucosaminyl deacetylase